MSTHSDERIGVIDILNDDSDVTSVLCVPHFHVEITLTALDQCNPPVADAGSLIEREVGWLLYIATPVVWVHSHHVTLIKQILLVNLYYQVTADH